MSPSSVWGRAPRRLAVASCALVLAWCALGAQATAQSGVPDELADVEPAETAGPGSRQTAAEEPAAPEEPTGQTGGRDPAATDDEGAELAPADAAPPADGEERMRMLVVEAATFGIDPVVGRVTSAVMRETAEAMGYRALTAEETVAAAQQLQMPYPPTPADLWRVSWVARAHRGAFARVWAHAGRYVLEISVASLDGSGPFFAGGTADAEGLRALIVESLRTALPAPSMWSEEGAAGAGRPGDPSGGGRPAEGSSPVRGLDDPAGPAAGARAAGSPPGASTPAEPQPELRRWSVTVQTEAAIGASDESFYNHLIGARLDFRITRNILLGAYFAYANLNARNGRADNLLFMLQFENRIRLSNDIDLTIPLRAAVGYLPFNGPVVRLAAGLNYAVSADWEIGVDLLVPTFWILPDHTAVSFDFALEGTLRF